MACRVILGKGPRSARLTRVAPNPSRRRHGVSHEISASRVKFEETKLSGSFTIDLTPIQDERGYFARAFSSQEFVEHGLNGTIVQANMSHNVHKGTLRGMHYQTPPATETKIVRCVRGAILDVIVDLRPDSPTYLQHVGVELTADNRRCLVVPDWFAHGFQTLVDDTEILYLVTQTYAPANEGGLRYDDPAFAVTWPLPVSSISDKDAAWPLISSGIPIMTDRRGLPPLGGS